MARVILLLAWPIVLARASQSIIGLCDALMVAPLGADALAATTTGALNSYSVVMFPMGTVFIVQSFASQLTGRGDAAAARRFGLYGLMFAAVFGAIGLACMPFVRPTLALFDYSPNVARLMGDYLIIRMLSIGAIIGTEVLGNWYGGIGRPMLQMVAGILAMVINVLLCWLLIYGHSVGSLTIPALGVSGSAWAATIGSWVGFLFLLGCFVREKIVAGALRLVEARRFLTFGIPNGFNWFLEFASFTIFINVLVARLGTFALAGINSVLQINGVAFMPAFALGAAGAILVGQSIGSRAPERVNRIVQVTVTIGALWMASVALTYLLFAEQIAFWFSPSGADGIAMRAIGATILRLSAGWQLFDAFSIILGEALRAAGDTRWCMWARIILAWCVFLPGAWIAIVYLHGGIATAVVSIIIYIAILSSLFLYRFLSGAWKRIELIEPVLPLEA